MELAIHQKFHGLALRRGTGIECKAKFIDNNLSNTKPAIIVDEIYGLWDMLEVISECPNQPTMTLAGPFLYMDGEGGAEGYGKGGTLYLWQIYVVPWDEVFVIDIYTMGSSAFTTRYPALNISLRDFLQSGRLFKGLWDPRKDSEMLSDNGVKLHTESIVDLQLMEVAARPDDICVESFLSYRNAVCQFAGLRNDERHEFLEAKGAGSCIPHR